MERWWAALAPPTWTPATASPTRSLLAIRPVPSRSMPRRARSRWQTRAQLDFETSPVFNLTVTVTDSGGLTDDAAVTVNLTDVNEAPTASDATFSLAENSGNGTVVGTSRASDPDAGDSLSYAITAGDPTGAFAINAATGEITVADWLSARLRDEPDLQPDGHGDGRRWPDGYGGGHGEPDRCERGPDGPDATFSLAENSADGTVGGQRLGAATRMPATASPTRSPAATRPAPSRSTPRPARSRWRTRRQLDFETTPVYNLTVTVTDAGGLTDDGRGHGQPDGRERGSDGLGCHLQPGGEQCRWHGGGHVSACDPDAGDSLSYAITGGDPTGVFAIDAGDRRDHGGGLGQLDFETTPVFNLTVTVTDSGGLTDTAAVTVNLTDVNEDPAARTPPSAWRRTAETAPWWAAFGLRPGCRGHALLRDHWRRSDRRLRHQRADGRDHGGGLGQLDFETTPVFNLTVTVTDSGGLTDEAAVTVNLTDVNEAPQPRTPPSPWRRTAATARSWAASRRVTRMPATASPTRSRAGTRRVPSRSTPRPARSRWRTRPQLDFETSPVFNLTVTVTDSGGLTDDGRGHGRT